MPVPEVYRVKVSQLPDFIVKRYLTGATYGRKDGIGSTLFLVGPPGIGKSWSVYRAAHMLANSPLLKRRFGGELELVEITHKEIDRMLEIVHEGKEEGKNYFILLDFRLTELSDPADLLGIPRPHPRFGTTMYIPPAWAMVCAHFPGILFLDELTNVQRASILSAAYKIILDRMAGFVKFHPYLMIIAAGNRPEHSSIARELPTPLVNRMIFVEVSPPTVDEWIEFMNKVRGKWYKPVGEYLLAHPNSLLKVPKEPELLENWPSPRSWDVLATELYLAELSKKAKISYSAYIDKIIYGCIGVTEAQKFKAFLEFREELLSRMPLNEVLKNPKKAIEYIFSRPVPQIKKSELVSQLIGIIMEKVISNIQELLMKKNISREELEVRVSEMIDELIPALEEFVRLLDAILKIPDDAWVSNTGMSQSQWFGKVVGMFPEGYKIILLSAMAELSEKYPDVLGRALDLLGETTMRALS